MRRPGVAIQISTPRCRSRVCGPLGAPPYTQLQVYIGFATSEVRKYVYSSEPSYDRAPPKTPDGRLRIDLPYQNNKLNKQLSGIQERSERNIREITSFHWWVAVIGFGFLRLWGLVSSRPLLSVYRTENRTSGN
jgi:hypothetical protein